jgi:electron transport complex protein RnfE
MKLQEFTKGIVKKNAVFALALGLCPTLAITTSVENALGMSFAVAFVLIFSNLIISAVRGLVPRKVRIPCFIVIIASLVTIIDLFMHGYFPTLYKRLGIFLPLIVVNCIILGRAEAFASKRSVFDTLLDAAGISVGFALAIILVSVIRELLGSGKIVVLGHEIVPAFISSPAAAMILPPGAFLTIGILLALLRRAGVA